MQQNNGRGASDEKVTTSPADGNSNSRGGRALGRRSFLKGLGMAGATFLPASALLTSKANANLGDRSGRLTRGDAAILRFLAAAEILESDLWEQYWELGGTPVATGDAFETLNGETPPSFSGGNLAYIAALQLLDGDMPQYITDNTDDEFSHAAFIRAYLASKGASTAEIDLLAGPAFRTIPGSKATGSSRKTRLTNLMQLTIDTSFWGRYRSDSNNPDLDAEFKFAEAVPSLNEKTHTAIPRTDDDTTAVNGDLIKAIAFTAGFHFAFIEQGGTSLYPELAQRVTDPEVLRILLSIGPTETMHFQTWQDKAGNANAGNPNPLTVFDTVNQSTVTFVDLTTDTTPETVKSNLIMPEPCPFLNRKFPKCSIIRPTQTKGAAMGAAAALAADGLFTGQSDVFFDLINDLASDADRARRGFERDV